MKKTEHFCSVFFSTGEGGLTFFDPEHMRVYHLINRT